MLISPYCCLIYIVIQILFPIRSDAQQYVCRCATDRSRIVGHYSKDGVGLDIYGDNTFTLVSSSSASLIHASGGYDYAQPMMHLVVKKYQNTPLIVDAPSAESQIHEILPPQVWVVPWAHRVYLLESRQILEFCNDVNTGWAKLGSLSNYFSLFNKHNNLVHRLPLLPSKWRGYLLTRPVIGRVLEVEDTGISSQIPNGEIIRVIADVGKQQGLKSGMKLLIRTTSNQQSQKEFHVQEAVIRSVLANRCIAELYQHDPNTYIAVGARLTTSLSKVEWNKLLSVQ